MTICKLQIKDHSRNDSMVAPSFAVSDRISKTAVPLFSRGIKLKKKAIYISVAYRDAFPFASDPPPSQPVF